MGLFRSRKAAEEPEGVHIKGTRPEPTAQSRIEHLERIQSINFAAIQDLEEAAARDAGDNARRYPGTTAEEWLKANEEARRVLEGIFNFTGKIIDELRSGIEHPPNRPVGPEIDISTDEEHWRKALSILRNLIDGIGARADEDAATMARLSDSGDVGQWRGAIAGFLNVTTQRFEELAYEPE